MQFEFSDAQLLMRDEVRRLLTDRDARAKLRAVLEGVEPYDRGLWADLGALGILGAAIPEDFGGSGAGYAELCIASEELGRALAATPFGSSICLAADLILRHGDAAQKRAYLPDLASGARIACLAFAEGAGNPAPEMARARAEDGRVSGVKAPVQDGMVADLCIVIARDAEADDDLSLFLVDLRSDAVTRTPRESLDPTRNHADISFARAPAERLGPAGGGWALLVAALDRAAIFTAFEQVGGAETAMEMARDYACERTAFGRPIGSFQAIKHKLADMYVAVTLARSNCYYGAWALDAEAPELARAAAAARVSATEAFQRCAKENIQVHGALGFTWEHDSHLLYRRSNVLALTLGGLSHWQDRLLATYAAEAAGGL